jgi:hypothetical protein
MIYKRIGDIESKLNHFIPACKDLEGQKAEERR